MSARILPLTLLGLSWALSGHAQTLKIATLAPEGSTWMTEMRIGAEQIEARTEDRVKFRFYGGGVQGKDSQVRRRMRIGQLQGATFTSGALGQLAPNVELYGLPLMFRNMEEVQYVRARMDHYLRTALEENGLVNFGLSGAGQSYLMSGTPVRNLDDLSGQKTWVQEGDQIAFTAFKSLGISPVPLPLTDVLTGLQTELLDSAAMSPVGAIVLQLHTKVKFITNLPLSYVYGALVIDAKPFSGLAEGDQAIVREVMEAIYRDFDARSVRDNAEALEALVGHGLALVEPEQDQIPQWQARIAKSNRELAEQGLISKALLDEMMAHLEEFRSSHAE